MHIPEVAKEEIGMSEAPTVNVRGDDGNGHAVSFTQRLLQAAADRAVSLCELTRSVPVEALLEGAQTYAQFELEQMVSEAGLTSEEVVEAIASIRWASEWEVWLPAGVNFGEVVIAARLCTGVWEQLPDPVKNLFVDPDGKREGAYLFQQKIDDVIRWNYVCGVLSGEEVRITETGGGYLVDLAS